MTQFSNTATLGGENQKDIDFLQKQQAVRQAVDANNQSLSMQQKAQVFEAWQVEQQKYLNEKHRELSNYIFQVNQERAAEAARNQIISTVLGVVGTIGGGIIGAFAGGPPGAALGAGIGSQAGKLGPQDRAQAPMPQMQQQMNIPEWKPTPLKAPSLLNPSQTSTGSNY